MAKHRVVNFDWTIQFIVCLILHQVTTIFVQNIQEYQPNIDLYGVRFSAEMECTSDGDCRSDCEELGIDVKGIMCFEGKCWCRPGWRRVQFDDNDEKEYE